jgi:hypothetical protein
MKIGQKVVFLERCEERALGAAVDLLDPLDDVAFGHCHTTPSNTLVANRRRGLSPYPQTTIGRARQIALNQVIEELCANMAQVLRVPRCGGA